MKPLNRRNEKLKSSTIREMTILSNEYNAINLAQGFPEFAPPTSLTARLKELAEQPVHQYTPNWGIDALREKVAKKESRKLNRIIDPHDEVLITIGSTEAMISSMMALLERGDKVGIFSPFYNSYEANTIITETKAVFIELTQPGFKLDPERLEYALKQGVKVLILCNPVNPCGRVFTRQELQQIAELVQKYDVYVITDEVYEHIVFEPHKHIGLASLPGMFERTLTCSSLSKTYSITGWRLGYVAGPLRLISEVRKYHDFFTVCAPGPLQEAAVTALSYTDEYYRELQTIYTEKKKRFLRGLDEAGILHNDPEGTYFVLADISEFGYESDYDFAKYLVKSYGVAGVPGSCFFADSTSRYIRFHFAKNDDTLQEVIERLIQLKKGLG